MAKQKKLEARARTQVVHETLLNLVAQVELDALQTRVLTMQQAHATLTERQQQLTEQHAHQQATLKSRDEEIQNLVESVQTLEEHLTGLDKCLKHKTADEPPRAWLHVFRFATFEELMQVRGVSKLLRELVSKFLAVKSNWRLLPQASLRPQPPIALHCQELTH